MFTTAFFCFSCGCLHYSLLLGASGALLKLFSFSPHLLFLVRFGSVSGVSHFTSSDTFTFPSSPCLYYRRRMLRVGNVLAILFGSTCLLLSARFLHRLDRRAQVAM
ncbi:hypothetical protein BDV23DRAFT_142923 [Aspergillus alliaceus]|uniref:Uncharacterized protein n=1 Tax=Petromyces alliaceus TaxID=209559 RepID=A0A5N7CR01_PETAA|nr:hypothetical protein BDV23DRAFT_142923 [Aspergillus alliaceus]